MEPIRAIIADDEQPSRERLRNLLAAETSIQLVTECHNGAQALRAIEEQRPDLAFLDVQMPGLNGFDVVNKVPDEKLPFVVFVSAHEHYALRAFEARAFDYLLKPLDPERFQSTLKRAVERISDSRRVPAQESKVRDFSAAPQPKRADRLALKT